MRPGTDVALEDIEERVVEIAENIYDDRVEDALDLLQTLRDEIATLEHLLKKEIR